VGGRAVGRRARRPVPRHPRRRRVGDRRRRLRSLVAHEQYLRGIGVDDPVAYATAMLDAQTAAVAERFGGRRGVAFELVPGPAAPAR
jgi:hypothetical protein